MTTPVCVRQRIRQLDRQGLSHKEISRKLGVSRTTVVKYANHGDYSPKPSNTARPGRSLVDDGYAAIVDGWPADDLRMPVKQRHTATRVYERLVAECGFTGSYSSVQRWIRRWRQEHRAQSDGFAELEWALGSAQVDFGQARAVVAGMERVVHSLAVSFPYSNMRWVAALPGETAECVCQGLLEVFDRTGMTPRWWCSTTPQAWATATPTARSLRPVCSPCSARTTGSNPGSATRIPATRRATWRTRSAS